jgi:hypothetical protein
MACQARLKSMSAALLFLPDAGAYSDASDTTVKVRVNV